MEGGEGSEGGGGSAKRGGGGRGVGRLQSSDCSTTCAQSDKAA